MKFTDKREEISIEDFREKFCKDCFWRQNNGCDIKVINAFGVEYCAHSQVSASEIKLKERG